MLAQERYAKITSMVESRGSVTVAELVDRLDISESTIRRDLAAMDAAGMVEKVRGGAIAVNAVYATHDDDITLRQERHRQEKQKIARYASQLIYPEDFVFIDAGTTTEILAGMIGNTDAVYVTNGIAQAMILSARGCRVYLLGGECKRATEAIVGEEAVSSVKKYNFTKGFFGTNGITRKNGFTTPEVKEAMVKTAAMENCRDCFVLADHSKFGQISAVTFGRFEKAMIITDSVGTRRSERDQNIVEVRDE